MADIAKVERDREANVAESGKISTEYEEALTSMSAREDSESFLSRLLDSNSMGVPEKSAAPCKKSVQMLGPMKFEELDCGTDNPNPPHGWEPKPYIGAM